MPSHRKGGQLEPDQLHARYPAVLATSPAPTITILLPSEYFALARSPPLLSATRTEVAFKNLPLHDLDAMMYYFDTDYYYNRLLAKGSQGMATILAHLAQLLVGAEDACTPRPWPFGSYSMSKGKCWRKLSRSGNLDESSPRTTMMSGQCGVRSRRLGGYGHEWGKFSRRTTLRRR